MAEWKYYRINMDLMGRMTQLPDSQKMFGALVHRFSETYSSVQATQMVDKIKGGAMPLSLSNMLPRGYLPAPHTELIHQLSVDGQGNKKIYQALKRRSYVKSGQLTELMKEPSRASDLYPYAHIEFTQQIHASIDSKRYNLPGLDPNLYSVPEVIVKEVTQEGKQEQTICGFSLYLAMEECSEGDLMLKMLELARAEGKTFILGPRGSQGLNTFKVTQIHEESSVTSNQTGYYLNLGMLLPKNIDFDRSSLKLFTSERRPYNPPGGWDTGNSGKFISFIEAGSIVYAPTGIECAGHSIQSPFHPRDIVFGSALLYPLSEREGD
ncbi:hypothetical protein C1I60_17215 [Paenibacillus terrae]|uniref:Uncharacterized protein n=1 Tax=Paenibacillus terrae TaxID=159743 RepID=A0A4U2PSA7_9BACL|nr:hypothetical protein [Paenibacillus terrae]TKH42542.1 hypothetical protein C1I60_17215 [Paenibacillus terrae]